MNEPMLAKGTLVYVTSYGPFCGCKGTIRAVDLIGIDGPAPVAFYLIALEDEPRTELWLEHDAVAEVSGNRVPFDGPR